MHRQPDAPNTPDSAPDQALGDLTDSPSEHTPVERAVKESLRPGILALNEPESERQA